MRKEKFSRVESEGSSIDEAIKNGLMTLNTTRDKVNVKVVCEEKKGLFGMDSAKPAKVIISIKSKKS